MGWICRLGNVSEEMGIHVKGGGTWRLPGVEVSGGLQTDHEGIESCRTCWAGMRRSHRTCSGADGDTYIVRRKA